MSDPNFRLKKGKFIDTQVGFVDAFNYMYENINGLEGGQGVELDKTIDGAWQINADGSDGGGDGGGGEGGKVDDVTVVPHGNNEICDKIQVDYVDGTSKTEDIPFDRAISSISRQMVPSSVFNDREVLSCVYNRGGGTFQVPFDIRISSWNGSQNIFNDSSRWALSAANDTNLQVRQLLPDNHDGIILQLGVYYI